MNAHEKAALALQTGRGLTMQDVDVQIVGPLNQYAPATPGARNWHKKLEQGRVLMVTHSAEGSAYGLDTGQAVPTNVARSLQGDLFVRPNNDGLFPGMTQTWRKL